MSPSPASHHFTPSAVYAASLSARDTVWEAASNSALDPAPDALPRVAGAILVFAGLPAIVGFAPVDGVGETGAARAETGAVGGGLSAMIEPLLVLVRCVTVLNQFFLVVSTGDAAGLLPMVAFFSASFRAFSAALSASFFAFSSSSFFFFAAASSYSFVFFVVRWMDLVPHLNNK